MTTDPKPPRYIFNWHPLPQPPWAHGEVEAWEEAIGFIAETTEMNWAESAAFVRKFGEVVEVQQ